MQRLNKEYKLDLNIPFNVIYGSVDRLKPQVIYICGKTWLLPQNNEEYEETINIILSNFKKEVKNKILNSTVFSHKYIIDFDLNPLTLNQNKKTFISFDIFVKQQNQPLIDLKSIKPYIISLFKDSFSKLSEDFNENYFLLNKTKTIS